MAASFSSGAVAFVTPKSVHHYQSSTFSISSHGSGGDSSTSGSSSSSSNNDDITETSTNFYNDFEDIDLSSSSRSSSTEISEVWDKLQTTNSENNDSNNNINTNDDSTFFSSLHKRQEQLVQSSIDLLEQWKSGSSKTFPAFTINESYYANKDKTFPSAPYSLSSSSSQDGEKEEEEMPFDWVRRMDVGTYPRVAVGSASGSIYIADVESKCLLGRAKNVHASNYNSKADGSDHKLRYYIYGEYDGGGVLSIAMFGSNLIASSGREGGVKLHKYNAMNGELQAIGDVPSLRRPLPGTTPVLIPCLKFDSVGRLYMGGQDGLLRIVNGDYERSDEMKVTVISSSKQQEQQQLSPILSLDICEELDMVACAHANGNICIYSINHLNGEEEGEHEESLLGIWNPFADTNNPCHARSVAFISCASGNGSAGSVPSTSWSIVAGGGNGEMWMQEIHASHIHTESNDAFQQKIDMQTTPAILTTLFKENSMQQVKPSHQGPVISLASRHGILVSAGHDGMLRVTEIQKQQSNTSATSRALYGFGGYKVWIGNICIDEEGKRLLSDGRDDVVVVHDFSSEEEYPLEE